MPHGDTDPVLNAVVCYPPACRSALIQLEAPARLGIAVRCPSISRFLGKVRSTLKSGHDLKITCLSPHSCATTEPGTVCTSFLGITKQNSLEADMLAGLADTVCGDPFVFLHGERVVVLLGTLSSMSRKKKPISPQLHPGVMDPATHSTSFF